MPRPVTLVIGACAIAITSFSVGMGVQEIRTDLARAKLDKVVAEAERLQVAEALNAMPRVSIRFANWVAPDTLELTLEVERNASGKPLHEHMYMSRPAMGQILAESKGTIRLSSRDVGMADWVLVRFKGIKRQQTGDLSFTITNDGPFKVQVPDFSDGCNDAQYCPQRVIIHRKNYQVPVEFH